MLRYFILALYIARLLSLTALGIGLAIHDGHGVWFVFLFLVYPLTGRAFHFWLSIKKINMEDFE
jgi:hypothetical protein